MSKPEPVIYDDALHMMEKQGGGFVQALVSCYYAADQPNKLALKRAFPKYFDDYRRRFDQWQKSQEGADKS